MKKILTIILLATTTAYGQIYQWTAGTNPLWTASGNLNFKAPCNVVTTNCTGNYNNNQDEYYTSPTINTTCNNASTVVVSFDIIGNTEFNYDAIFLEYSLNNGATWIFLQGWTGNFASVTNIANAVPTSVNFKFRFNFYSDWSGRSTGYKITNFKINCNVVLPIELLSFEGNCNQLTWSTASERSNSHFDIESTLDGTEWINVGTVNGSGDKTTKTDYSYPVSHSGLIYYRLSQTDYNGQKTYFDPISVDCGYPETSTYYDMTGKMVSLENVSSGIYLKVTGKKVERVYLE